MAYGKNADGEWVHAEDVIPGGKRSSSPLPRVIDEAHNEAPFEHITSDGVGFRCLRCDLSEPIMVNDIDVSSAKLCKAVAEMIGYHAVAIRPSLKSFRGYDTVSFVFVSEWPAVRAAQR